MGITRRTAWREPMLWLVAGLPVLVIGAACATISLARHATRDDSASQTRRIAQVQLEDLAADREAARRGLRARIEVDAAAGALQVVVAPAPAADAALVLELIHPVDARADRRMALVPSGGEWTAQTSALPRHRWTVRLSDPRAGWRLGGNLAAHTSSAQLRPAVTH